MQRDKRKHEQEKLVRLQERQKLLDAEIERSQLEDSEAQTRCLDRIRELEAETTALSNRLGDRRDTSPDYCRLVDVLDLEKKAFEDLEFKHLEEEANWLATREDLQREIDEISHRIEGRHTRLQELESQVCLRTLSRMSLR